MRKCGVIPQWSCNRRLKLAVWALEVTPYCRCKRRKGRVTLAIALSGGAAVELFRAEKIATVNDHSNQDCRLCGGKLTLLKTMVEAESGVVNHLFECQRCGERTWTD